jgi:hypothetical protein
VGRGGDGRLLTNGANPARPRSAGAPGGVFVAGNIIKDVQLVIVAAAEGTRAAFGINRALTREDFDRKATGSRGIEHPSIEDPEMHRRRTKRA